MEGQGEGKHVTWLQKHHHSCGFLRVRMWFTHFGEWSRWCECLSYGAWDVTDPHKVLQHLTIILNVPCEQENGTSASHY